MKQLRWKNAFGRTVRPRKYCGSDKQQLRRRVLLQTDESNKRPTKRSKEKRRRLPWEGGLFERDGRGRSLALRDGLKDVRVETAIGGVTWIHSFCRVSAK